MNAIRAEWIKVRSLRSTWYTLGALFVLGLGITALTMSSMHKQYFAATPAERAGWDPTGQSLKTYIVAQLVVGVFGILIVTSEFATGLIQTTLAANPRRSRLLAAKALVATVLAAVAGQILMFSAFLLGQGILAAQGVPSARLGDPGVLAAVTGGGLYLSAIALLALGLGAIMRATAGALATLVGIVFLVPALSGLFPSWLHGVLACWPTLGAATVLGTVPDPQFPHPWLGLGGLWLGVLAVLTAAFLAFRRRDV
jgi:ABC-2 type transport system permease protein